MILLSPLRNTEVAGDIIASALYVANWHFAAQSVDYFAQGLEPSPVLHLWSLAIEEQFYLVWPGLILAVDLDLPPPRPARSARCSGSSLALILAGSLIYGIDLTDEQAGLRLLLHLRPRLGARARRRARAARRR